MNNKIADVLSPAWKIQFETLNDLYCNKDITRVQMANFKSVPAFTESTQIGFNINTICYKMNKRRIVPSTFQEAP